ncbi:MAG: ROK family protein [Syntrophobacteraceae bacterium]
MIRIGVDLGGTKIEAIAMDGAGVVRARSRLPTPRDGYAAIMEAIAGLVHAVEEEAGGRGTVGIGTPGAISRASGLLKNSNSTCLNGKPVLQDLQEKLEREVRISNDANCFALSEARDGAAAGAGVVFGVIVGTGTGAGVVVHGRVLDGINGIAGEWGHNPLPWPKDEERPGPACYCGKYGCVETFLSGPGMSASYRRLAGKSVEPAEIVVRAEQGHSLCERVVLDYEDRMARALAHVINILDPDAIVLGGGMSNIRRLYEEVPKLWSRYVFSDRVDTRLLPPRHGDSSGVRGAAWLWG